MNNLCTDVGYHSLYKHGEQLCGDHVDVIEKGDDYTVLVLADGLGSGVKASILSTLTSKIISTMMANEMSIEECVSTIAATLPVCEVRKVAYSTFTIMRILNNNEAELIQYDNPHVILLRDGKNFEYEKQRMETGGKVIYTSKIQLCENDVFIAMSDGAIYAGVGKYMNFGWQRENIIDYIEKLYDDNYTAKVIATLILDECDCLYGGEPGDDTTVAAIKIRTRKPVNMLFGPPSNPDDVNKMMSLFFSKDGKRIVCGGTTSMLAAQYLGEEVMPDLDYFDPDIPPIAHIKGIDLTTEGVITMTQVLKYAQNSLTDNVCYYDWPTFDIEGTDSAHKLMLLSAIAFGVPVDMSKVHIEGITHLEAKDIKFAEELGYRIKLLGITKYTDYGIELRVHPALVPTRRLLANVEGAMNAVVVKGDAAESSLYYGKGAGSEPTGSAVVADLIDIARTAEVAVSERPRMPTTTHNPKAKSFADFGDTVCSYYLRIPVEDKPGVLAEIARILADNKISIESLIQKEAPLEDASTEIILLTHSTREADIQRAIRTMQQLANVRGAIVLLRKEELQ